MGMLVRLVNNSTHYVEASTLAARPKASVQAVLVVGGGSSMFTAAEVARGTFWSGGRKSAGGERGNVTLLCLAYIYIS